jgi:hypothetical protein
MGFEKSREEETSTDVRREQTPLPFLPFGFFWMQLYTLVHRSMALDLLAPPSPPHIYIYSSSVLLHPGVTPFCWTMDTPVKKKRRFCMTATPRHRRYYLCVHMSA